MRKLREIRKTRRKRGQLFMEWNTVRQICYGFRETVEETVQRKPREIFGKYFMLRVNMNRTLISFSHDSFQAPLFLKPQLFE